MIQTNLRQIIDACHEEGIRVIARTDFSKVRYDLYEQHPEWAYRTAKGEIVNYNGEYQQMIMFEIRESDRCVFFRCSETPYITPGAYVWPS
jgi:hypothetical protein